MRTLAAVFGGKPGEISLQQLTTPAPVHGEILTRLIGCTLCGSDLHTFTGKRTVPVPTILGHEYVAEILELGAGAPRTDITGQPLGVGDRVTWAIVASCGECFFCHRGLPQKCEHGVKYGHEAFAFHELVGGLAEHCLLVPGTSIVRLPESLPLEVGCPVSCATATIAAAFEAAGPIAERSVCILGSGLLGLTACAFAKTAGAATVLAVDIDESRLQLARAFGASHTAFPPALSEIAKEVTDKNGLDVVIELSGATSAFETAWPLLRTGGTVVLVGAVFPGPAVLLHLEHIVRRNLTICGVHNYAPTHLASAVRFMNEHHDKFPFEALVSEWFPLKRAPEAFQRALEPGVVRIGIRP